MTCAGFQIHRLVAGQNESLFTHRIGPYHKVIYGEPVTSTVAHKSLFVKKKSVS